MNNWNTAKSGRRALAQGALIPFTSHAAQNSAFVVARSVILDGIRVATSDGMFIQVFNPATGRRARMEARALSKVLHLACFHGWRPELLDAPPPLASWDTEIVMPYVTPYLSGTVSNSDADGLAAALKRVLASEGSGLQSEIYVAVLGLTAIAEGGGFNLKLEDPLPGEDKSQWTLPAGREDNPTLSSADHHTINVDAGRSCGTAQSNPRPQ